MRRIKNQKQEERIIELFNKACLVGDKVKVTKDDGTTIETLITAPAQLICGSAVIWLQDIKGCYLLDRVTPIEKVTISK